MIYPRFIRQQFLSLAVLLMVLAGTLAAQSPGLQLTGLVEVPHSRIQPGSLLTLQADVTNTGDAEATGIVVATIDGRNDLQNARRVTVAPNSTKSTFIYLHIPKSVAGKQLVEIVATLFISDGNREVVQTLNGQPARKTVSLAPDPQETLAAFILDPESATQPYWFWPPNPPSTSYELAVASRIDAGFNRYSANYEDRSLPISRQDWEVMGTVVLGEEAALQDAVIVESLKQFVTNGGKLWVLLDRISSESIRPLLAADQICETVDEVEFNEFVVEVIGGVNPISEQDRRVKSYSPLKMKRVVQHGGRVTHQIDGWPAAIWMPMGYGEILITTLDCAAWIRSPENPGERPGTDSPFYAAFQSNLWANQLTIDINASTLDKPLLEPTDYPLGLIGNPVVPKSWVTAALTGFCVLLGVIGVWRSIAGELSLLGLIAPIIAVLVGAGLVVASSFVRKDIPESVSRLQLVQVSDDGSFAMVREQSAVYLTNAANMNLESDVDGRAVVDEGLESGIKRYEVVDHGEWQLSNENWPPGTWRYQSDYVIPTEDLVVQAELSSTGVQLKLPQLPSALEDPVLNYNLGDPMLCESAGEGLFADGSLSAEGDRWIAGALISKEQQRRLEVYQQFFKPDDRTQVLSRVLYGWTSIWPDGPKWSRPMQENGSAMVTLPVRLVRPQPATEIYIPHGLVQLRRDPREGGSTFAFSNVTGKWVQDGLTKAIEAPMQFVLPEEVLPFEVRSIEMSLDIKAPKRDVSIVATTDQGPIEIVSLNSPSIPWSGTITNPDILSSLSDGILDVKLAVSERTDIGAGESSTNVVPWQVESFHANIRGMTLGATQ